MRFIAGFAVVLALVLGVTWLGAGPPRQSVDEPQVLGEQVATDDDDGAAAEPDATPTVVPTATLEPTPTPDVPETITLSFSGEVLSHGPIISQALADGTAELPYNYLPMFAEVRPLLEAADLSICHVETPISSDNTNLSGYPIFNAPREMAAGLKATGYGGCSTASNHSYDKGPDGIRSTLNQMEAAGLPWAGMARTAEEQATPTLYEVGGVTIGHLSYSYGLNGFVLPADQPYLVSVTDVPTVLAEAAAAKAAGADIVVLSIQWGNEYQHDPTPLQVEQATAFLSSPDIDLIMGAHVHVVQPAERINGKWVVYGMGNFLSNQSANCCPAASQNGTMFFVDITGTEADGYRVTDLSFVPTRVDRSDYTIVPLPVALADPALDPGVRQLYEQVMAETTEIVNRLGAGLEITDLAALGVTTG